MTLRPDPITGELRLVAPGRAERLGVRPAGCPFCRGNESATPAETGRVDDPDGSGWIARSFPNRYPLTAVHEVLVPSPRHLTSWRELTLPELEAGLALLARRRVELLQPGRYLHAFANDGDAAGASLPHVHAQLVSVPAGDHAEHLTRNVRDPTRCALCALVIDPDVVIEQGRHVALLAHPVPRLAGGLIVTPLDHATPLGDSPPPELAALLHRGLQALDSDLDANLWLVADDAAGAHWYLELQPRSAGIAGVELALGLHVVAADPAQTAARARERLAMPARH